MPSTSTTNSITRCSRCHMAGHAAMDCKVPFLRSACPFCKRLGHSEAECRLKRKAEASEREAASALRKAEAEKRKEAWEAKQAEYMEKKAAWQAQRAKKRAARNGQQLV